MAAITSTANGNWSAGGTWVGGVAPGNGDTATVGHVVTVTADQIVGHSPAAADVTAAVLCTAGGTVSISAGITFTCRGDFKCSNSNTVRSLILGAGAIFEFDASLAASPSTARYVCQLTSQYAGTQPVLLISGTAGSRCTFRSNASGANGRFSNNGTYGGLLDASYCDFTRIGDASNNAFPALVNGDSVFTMNHCTMDACGDLNFNANQMGATGIFVLQNCTWKNTVASSCITTYMYTDKSGATSQRLIDSCVFDKHCYIYAPRDATITNNFFYESFTNGTTNAEGCTFTGNFVCLSNTNNTVVPYSADIDGNVFFYKDVTTNPHFVQLGWTNLATQRVQNCIFEFAGTDGAGDCLMFGAPGAAVTLNIDHNIFLPNSGAENSGTPLSALGNANITFTFDHNTFFSGSQGIAVGETYAGHTGMASSIRSNIAWNNTSQGYFIQDSGGDDTVSNLVSPANLDYNCAYLVQNGSNGHGINNMEFSGGSPATHNVDVDPQFVDKGANLAKWDLSLGGAGSNTNALTELMKLNDSDYDSDYSVANFKAYIIAKFTPSNTLLDGVSHDSAVIGAVNAIYEAPVVVDPPVVPPVVPPTSSTATAYDFTQTRDQIISRALRIVGALTDGDTASTEQISNADAALNAMVKRWQNDHIHLWTVKPIDRKLSANTAVYPLATDPKVHAVQAAYIDTQGTTSSITTTTTNTASLITPVPRKAEFWAAMAEWSGYVDTYLVAEGLSSSNALASVYYDGELGAYQLSTYFADTSTYYPRADNVYAVYVTNYLVPNAYGASGYRAFAEGLIERAIRRNDSQAVTDVALLLAHAAYHVAGDFNDHELSRECAYVLLNHIQYARVATLTTAQQNRMQYAYDKSLDMIDWWCISQTATYFRPFMGGITAHALIEYYERQSKNQEIVDNLIILADYMWDSCWDDASQSFTYTDRDGTGETWHSSDGDLTPTPDLNQLISPLFGWLWKVTGQQKWRDRGDLIWKGGIPVYSSAGSWISGAWLGTRDATNPKGKQLFQQLVWGPRYIEYAESSPSGTGVVQPPITTTTTTPPVHSRLKQITFSDYQDIYDKSSPGTPMFFAIDKSTSPSIYLWPVPSQAYNLRYVGVTLLRDFDSSTDTPDAPARWIDAIVYGLADSLADEYPMPMNKRLLIAKKAEDFKKSARIGDKSFSDETYFEGAF